MKKLKFLTNNNSYLLLLIKVSVIVCIPILFSELLFVITKSYDRLMPITAWATQTSVKRGQTNLGLYLFNQLSKQKMVHVINHYHDNSKMFIDNTSFPNIDITSHNPVLEQEIQSYLDQLNVSTLPSAPFDVWGNVFYTLGDIFARHHNQPTADAYWKLALIFDPYKTYFADKYIHPSVYTQLLIECQHKSHNLNDCNVFKAN